MKPLPLLAILILVLATLINAAPTAPPSDLAPSTASSPDLVIRNTSTNSASSHGYQVFCFEPDHDWYFWSCLLPPDIKPSLPTSPAPTSTSTITPRTDTTPDFSIGLNVIRCLTQCNCDRCGRMSCFPYFDCTSQEVLSVCMQLDKGNCGCMTWGAKRDGAVNGTEADVDVPEPHCRSDDE